jgi:hypothetical protein
MKVKRLWNRVNGQIFVWAGEEPKEVKYSGFRFKLPPRTETAKLGPGSIYRFESVRDSKDELIPGTAWVTDVVVSSDSGGRHRVFDVSACCEFLQESKSKLFEEGFAIVSDVNDVRPAMEELRPLYDKSQDVRAQGILGSELDRQRKYQDKGQAVPEPDNPERVEWAMKHMARRRKSMKPTHGMDNIQAVLEGRFDDVVRADKSNGTPAPIAAFNPEPMDGRELFKECNEWGVRLSKREVEALLEGDEEQIAFIVAKLKVKREATTASPA